MPFSVQDLLSGVEAGELWFAKAPSLTRLAASLFDEGEGDNDGPPAATYTVGGPHSANLGTVSVKVIAVERPTGGTVRVRGYAMNYNGSVAETVVINQSIRSENRERVAAHLMQLPNRIGAGS